MGGFSGLGFGTFDMMTGTEFLIGMSSPDWLVSLIGATLSLGISNGGIGFTVAHELIHRSSKFEQWLGRALLLTTLYMHFAIEHVYGYHKHVELKRMPQSARKGETFYRFLIVRFPININRLGTLNASGFRKKRRGFGHSQMKC